MEQVAEAPGSQAETAGERLAAALVALAPPPDTLETVRRFVLDSLGVIIAARDAPGIRELAAACRALDPAPGPATELATGARVSGPMAALINGASAHALEFDDTDDIARIHAYCAVLPAALAAAEIEPGIDGARLLDAVAVGVETFCRLGHAAPGLLVARWHPTVSIGSIAAAAGAARLLSLDARGMANAMGFGFSQLCGTTQSLVDNALAKRVGPGYAARNGLTAAYLARAGLSGPRGFLDGVAGFFAMYGEGGVRPEALFDGLGRVWMLERVSVKPFPSCRCTHTLIQLGLDLHAEGLRADDIVSGELLLGEVNWGVVNAPFRPEAAVDPVVHAQFNACYAFARAILDGAVGLDSFLPARILAPESKLAERLVCRRSDDIAPNSLPAAAVALTLRDGSRRTARSDTMPGSPEAPLSLAALRAKFVANLAYGRGAPPAEAEALADMVLGLKAGAGLRRTISALARTGAARPRTIDA